MSEALASMSGKNQRVAALLAVIERELRGLQLWEAEPPSVEALSSVEPFCVDTLNFPQWLQHVFLFRMDQLLKAELALPESCDIEPMATVYFGALKLNSSGLLKAIADIDKTLNV